MAPTDTANGLLGSRPRPSTVRHIIPAIPLPYIQKRKQHAAMPKKTEEVPIFTSPADTPTTTSPPIVDIPACAANGDVDAIGDVQVDAELPPATPATRTVENDVETPVGEAQEDTAEAPPAGL